MFKTLLISAAKIGNVSDMTKLIVKRNGGRKKI
jgi:hypothetical protein